jgi:hypothetical protein
MTAIPYPSVETERLGALEHYRVLDTPPEPVFDRISELAELLLLAPISMVGLIDAERHWFKAARGVGRIRQNARIHSFCTYTILSNEVLIVPDAQLDARFATIPPVADFGIRFYAGAPLTTVDGFHIGSVCIFDFEPRASLPEDHHSLLRYLARVTMSEFEHRLSRPGLSREHRLEQHQDAARTLLGQFVASVPSAEHMAALEVSAVVRVTTESLLSEVLQTSRASELFEWLEGLSFIESGLHGLHPHDLAREMIVSRLRERDPESHTSLHERARAYSTRRILETRGLEQQRVLFDDLFLHRDPPGAS